MGVFRSAATLSYGIEVMTPAVIESPEASTAFPISMDTVEALCECREDLDPLVLLAPLGRSGVKPPSS